MIKFIRRAWYLGWNLFGIIISGVCGMLLTGVLVVALAKAGHSQIAESGAGIAGGAISGYIWGRIFSSLAYRKYKKMMAEQGIPVYNND